MLKRRDIRVRDPFIVLDDGKYYMYATSGERTMSYYVSDDLENWEESGIAFEIPEDFWAYKDGRKIMCIHAPERDMDERAHLFNMVERENKLEIIEELPI